MTKKNLKRLHFTLFVLITVSILTISFSGTHSSKIVSKQNNNDTVRINDGPYIFITENNLIEKRIVKGKLKTTELPLGSKKINFKPDASVYKNVKKIAALSDIHGQYDLAIKVLKNNKIINKNLEWNFGKGHLVIVGDIFDRGDKVTETLWFMYNLEQQAEKKGGKIHYLMGNHEYMIMHNDLRYVNKKYKITSELMNTTYKELFGKQTVLGRWLRSKSTIVQINDNIFVHGGISNDFLLQGFNIDEINNLMRSSLDRTKQEMKSGPFYKKYYGPSGPIWYRGYFRDHLEEQEIDTILNKLNASHIIVGHTSQKEVKQLYHKKIFAVDSSIKKGHYGEILFITKNSFCRGTMEGEKIKF